jgi:uncharacterized membrane protein YgcG
MQQHSRHARHEKSADFLGSEDIMGVVHATGRAVIFLTGKEGENDAAWHEQLELIAELKQLGDTSKIALAILLCHDNALRKARAVPRNDTTTCKSFLEKLMQALAPENRLKYWEAKLNRIELCENEPIDSVYTRICEEADNVKSAQADLWTQMSDTERMDFLESVARRLVRPQESSLQTFVSQSIKRKTWEDLSDQEKAQVTEVPEPTDQQTPYYMRDDRTPLLRRIDFNQVNDTDFLKLVVDDKLLLEVLKSALWNWPALKRTAFLLKHTTLREAVKDLEDTRRHAMKMFAENPQDMEARRILVPTVKGRILDEQWNAPSNRGSQYHRSPSVGSFPAIKQPYQAADGQFQIRRRQQGSPGGTPRPQPSRGTAFSDRSKRTNRGPPSRFTYDGSQGNWTNNVEQFMDEVLQRMGDNHSSQNHFGDSNDMGRGGSNRGQSSQRGGRGGRGGRGRGGGSGGGSGGGRGGSNSGSGSNRPPAQWNCKVCKEIHGLERKHYLSDCPHGDEYRDMIAKAKQSSGVNNFAPTPDDDDSDQMDHKHVGDVPQETDGDAKKQKKKSLKKSRRKAQVDARGENATSPSGRNSQASLGRVEEERWGYDGRFDDKKEEDWADMEDDNIYFPPLSGTEGGSDDDRVSINHVSFISASHAQPRDIQALNLAILEERGSESLGVSGEDPKQNFMPDFGELQHGEYEATLDVEAEILRDQVYDEVVREARGEQDQEQRIHINAAASYDNMQSTVKLRIKGGKGLITALCDTGAHIPLVRDDQVPNGAVTKQLKRPLHIAGYDGTTAERVSTMARLLVQTENGDEFQPQWHYVVKKCNYDVIFSKEWLNIHKCHWQMSSDHDDISLLSTNRGRISLESRKVEEVRPSVSVVRPRKFLSANKVLNAEIDGEVVGRLLLTEDLEVQARYGEVPELKVRFVSEPGVHD